MLLILIGRGHFLLFMIETMTNTYLLTRFRMRFCHQQGSTRYTEGILFMEKMCFFISVRLRQVTVIVASRIVWRNISMSEGGFLVIPIFRFTLGLWMCLMIRWLK
ncbi:MAG: hypothetical protein CL537_05000 [Alcanivoracaceae bacterium]|nr:hypothetical protein [Alcanivoracaceae bacterium]